MRRYKFTAHSLNTTSYKKDACNSQHRLRYVLVAAFVQVFGHPPKRSETYKNTGFAFDLLGNEIWMTQINRKAA